MLDNRRAKFIGDATEETALNFQRWDELDFTVNKVVTGEMRFNSDPGSIMPVSLGSVFEPNRLIQAAYWMNDIDGNQAPEEVGFSSGDVENVSVVMDSLGSVDNSYLFVGDSSLRVPNAVRTQLADQVSFRINVKATEQGGVIINNGQGLVLELLDDGSLQLTARTQDATKSLNLPNFCLLYTSPSPRDRG